MPSDCNVKTSHSVYKIKNEEEGMKKLKAHLCPLGNREMERGNIRNGSGNAQFYII